MWIELVRGFSLYFEVEYIDFHIVVAIFLQNIERRPVVAVVLQITLRIFRSQGARRT